ncbi:MAG: hypothetical protein ACFFAO_02160 [Candidatus Hermodarchaeota archaeon]
MLVLIIGENGSGKTLIMVLFALSNLSRNILANFTIKHPHWNYLEIDDFLNIQNNTDVYIDEAYTWLEKRRSLKYTNLFISQTKEQKRKDKSTWYISQQRPNLIDKRFEEFCNVKIECKTRYPIGNSYDDFIYKFTYEDLYYPIYKRLSYEDAMFYFKYFDTYEKVPPENKQKMEFEFIKNNPDKLFKKVISIAKQLEKTDIVKNIKLAKEITHDTMNYILMDNRILKDYEPYLYTYFKYKLKNNGSV